MAEREGGINHAVTAPSANCARMTHVLRTLALPQPLAGELPLLASPLLGDDLCFTAWLERLER